MGHTIPNRCDICGKDFTDEKYRADCKSDECAECSLKRVRGIYQDKSINFDIPCKELDTARNPAEVRRKKEAEALGLFLWNHCKVMKICKIKAIDWGVVYVDKMPVYRTVFIITGELKNG